jgi:hypothetical protein
MRHLQSVRRVGRAKFAGLDQKSEEPRDKQKQKERSRKKPRRHWSDGTGALLDRELRQLLHSKETRWLMGIARRRTIRRELPIVDGAR